MVPDAQQGGAGAPGEWVRRRMKISFIPMKEMGEGIGLIKYFALIRVEETFSWDKVRCIFCLAFWLISLLQQSYRGRGEKR